MYGPDSGTLRPVQILESPDRTSVVADAEHMHCTHIVDRHAIVNCIIIEGNV